MHYMNSNDYISCIFSWRSIFLKYTYFQTLNINIRLKRQSHHWITNDYNLFYFKYLNINQHNRFLGDIFEGILFIPISTWFESTPLLLCSISSHRTMQPLAQIYYVYTNIALFKLKIYYVYKNIALFKQKIYYVYKNIALFKLKIYYVYNNIALFKLKIYYVYKNIALFKQIIVL